MNIVNYWIYLLIAIPFGVLGTISMKLSDGLKKWKPSVSLFICYVISFCALTMALRGIEMSVVYAIWSGIGTILVAMVGIAVFEESISWKKIMCILLIVAGVIGIQLADAFK